MKVSLFYLPAVGNRQQIEQGMAGTRPELYQQMLKEISEQCRLADEIGYDVKQVTTFPDREAKQLLEGFHLRVSGDFSTSV